MVFSTYVPSLINLDLGGIIIRKIIGKQKVGRNICSLFEHFSSNDHKGFLEDCSITLLDKTDGFDLTRREEYWRRVLRPESWSPITPYGLNAID